MHAAEREAVVRLLGHTTCKNVLLYARLVAATARESGRSVDS